jgi:hypothetical protein
MPKSEVHFLVYARRCFRRRIAVMGSSVEMVRGGFQPSSAPGSERLAHRLEVPSGRGELVEPAATARVGLSDDDLKAFELAESLAQQAAGDAGRSGLQFAERPAAEQQVADDDRRPAGGEDLRRPGDRENG